MAVSSLYEGDSITDVRFEGNTAILIRHKNWSANEIEEQVRDFSYSGENLRKDPEVEKAKLPPFALAFYKFIFFKSRLPNETELWNYYLSQYFKSADDHRISYFRKGTLRTYSAEAVRARMLRSFPSLIRDFHFFVLCQESDLFERVSYSLREDYLDGTDLNIVFRGNVFRVSVMLNSERARTFKLRKHTRHGTGPHNEIVMLFDLYKNVNIKGRIKLFSDKHVSELLLELQKYKE
ncbi:MAG: hypothetical protein U0X91_12430 [Spirosomataceae bacterium]